MVIAKIQVDGTHITRLFCGDIPRGIIGAQVEIEYTDPVWDGLNKTVVFDCCGVCKDVVTNSNLVTIPVEVVQTVGVILSIGVFGTDADENVAIPTILGDLGYIRVAADPSGDESTDPTLPVWAQIADDVEELKKRVDDHPGGGGVQFEVDNTLRLENGVLSVNTTNQMEQDNTLPMTSAGVYATVGNIEALLKTI